MERSTSEGHKDPFLDINFGAWGGNGGEGGVRGPFEMDPPRSQVDQPPQDFDPWCEQPDDLHAGAAAANSKASKATSDSSDRESGAFGFRSAHHVAYDPCSKQIPDKDQVQRRLKAWATDGSLKGSTKPIRELLTTMHEVLPPQLGFATQVPRGTRLSEAEHWARWERVTLAEVLEACEVKRLVNRARLVVAPDKLPRGVTSGATAVCAELYRVINVAFSEFRTREVPPGTF